MLNALLVKLGFKIIPRDDSPEMIQTRIDICQRLEGIQAHLEFIETGAKTK